MISRRNFFRFSGCLMLCGCSGVNPDAVLGSGTSLVKAAALSDADVTALSNQSCALHDRTAKIAAAGSPYARRLKAVMQGLGSKVNGQTVDARVYMTKDVNAWAMGNGAVRVYSGLMDMMNDDELRGVIGHEMAHVALGHTKHAMQVAYATSAARGLVGAAGNSVVASLSQSQLGDLGEKFVNAQFSQSQESAADDYSFDMLSQRKLNRQGLVTAFQKLAQLDGGKGSMFSSHPSSPDRAKHIQQRIAQNA
ncbi:M48 family metallopeptidase [Paraburkholderia sediminicola]|jgi:putative metalloprotease|nr:M48 family metallopeptidase [Paraburkholderia sediminicola]